MMKDFYLTISEASEGFYKEKGSKFICYLSPTESIDDFENFMLGIKKQHPKARHFCYAYKMGIEGEIFRINDDGEPSGTAGKPIYGQLQSWDITNVTAIIVRYFGGTKLGASGLIKAYKAATLDAIEHSTIVERIVGTKIKISFEYGEMGTILKCLKDLKIELDRKSFEVHPFVVIDIRKSEVEKTIKAIKAKLLNRDVQDIDEDTEIEQCKIEPLD